VKRPFCTWDGSTCSFAQWKGQSNGTVAWYWAKDQVPFDFGKSSLGAATGGLRMEPQSFLKFMAGYWIGGYNSGQSPASFDPYIGEPRANNWGISTNHNGSVGGGYAYAIHRSNGVDLIVAVNQSGGKSGAAFSSLYDVMVDGINQVDWSNVAPLPQLQP
jgi:hypothetical protein